MVRTGKRMKTQSYIIFKSFPTINSWPIIKRMTDAELLEIFEFINRLLKKHLAESEYHQLFLKDND